MEYGKKKKMMYGGMAKKKMYGGGMTKKKKMAMGGSVDFSDAFDDKGNPKKTVKGKMLEEIQELKYLARTGTPRQKAEAKKLIKQKQAGIKAGEKLVQTKKGRVYGRAIPTFEDAPDAKGLGMGQKDRMDKYMQDQKILKKEQKRVKKAGGSVKKKMAMGGKMKPVDKKKNPGLAKLPTEVRNKMGFMKKGGMAKKKMMGGGMTIKKMKRGGKAGKCPRDGIAMRGKTRAGRK